MLSDRPGTRDTRKRAFPQDGPFIRQALECFSEKTPAKAGLLLLRGLLHFAGELAEALAHARRQQAGSFAVRLAGHLGQRSEEHTSELQSLMRNSYAVFRLKKKNKQNTKSYRHAITHIAK